MDAPHVVAQWTRKVAVLTLVRITATKVRHYCDKGRCRLGIADFHPLQYMQTDC